MPKPKTIRKKQIRKNKKVTKKRGGYQPYVCDDDEKKHIRMKMRKDIYKKKSFGNRLMKNLKPNKFDEDALDMAVKKYCQNKSDLYIQKSRDLYKMDKLKN